jgi:hypothetical protein
MPDQRIILGDCLDVFRDQRGIEAFVSDPPANINFMGRSWDTANPALDYVPLIPPRDKAHLRELQREHAFTKYWAERYAMAYDVADQHASALIWTLPRTSHQTATALRAGGWTIRDNIVHLFGTGWAKTDNALAPGQEGWLLCTKGKPDLDIDACRVPRGERDLRVVAEHDYHGNTYGERKGCKAAGKTTDGSLPKNALLSHCEECVRVGSKRVAGGASGQPPIRRSASNNMAYGADQRLPGDEQIKYVAADGTESTPAFHCLAGCSCGARTPWPDDRPLPRCPCGETWRWLCPVAEVNAQSGNRPGMSGGGKHRADYASGLFGGIDCDATTYADRGGAARFFNSFQYLSKCGTAERHAGCENLFWKADKRDPFGFVHVSKEEWEALADDGRPHDRANSPTTDHGGRSGTRARGNVHPTVKSYRLMHWLHTLTGAKRIGDLTGGSGTGMLTAYLDGIDWLGAEMCPQAIVIANARLAFWKGLSFDAREAFMRDDVVPVKPETKAIQGSLFE